MRISSSTFGARMLAVLHDLQQRQIDVSSQVASNSRIQHASDDPVKARELSLINQQSADLARYDANIGMLDDRLERAEAYLDGIGKTLTAAHSLLLWAADGGNAPSDVNAMRQQLAGYRDDLLNDANFRDGDGYYVFSGTAIDRATIVSDPSAPAGRRYRFGGNTDTQRAVVGHDILVEGNASLDEMPDLLNRLDAALDLMAKPDVSMNDPTTRKRITACLDALDRTLTSVSGKQATLGATRDVLSGLTRNHEQIRLANAEAVQRLNGVDMADAAVQIAEYRVTLSASMQIYGQVSKLSLFSVL